MVLVGQYDSPYVRRVAVALHRLGCFGEEQERALACFLRPVIRNATGGPVGTMRPAGALAASL